MLLQKRRRHAFTLIELLVVITLVIALAGIVALVVPGISDQRKVSRGADQLQGWLLIAKQSALRDRSPRGIRLIEEPIGSKIVSQLQYIEVPDNYSPIGATLRVQQAVLPAMPITAPGYVPTQNVVTVTGDLTPFIQGGDFLEILTPTPMIYKIADAINWPWGGMPPVLINYNSMTDITTFSVTTPIVTAPINTQSGFQFIRSARPLLGEEPLRLPQGVIIDLNDILGSPPVPAPTVPTDILFSPSGQVVTSGTNATGRIVLHVRDNENPPVGTPTLITIYSRTGAIAAHPINTSGGDPYSYTTDGKSSGL